MSDDDPKPGVFRTRKEAVRYIAWWVVGLLSIVIIVFLAVKLL
jgi:hypothetical protein